MTQMLLAVRNLGKTFTLHLQGGTQLPVLSGLSFEVGAGECVVLGGPSGAGKSSILKMIYGSYGAEAGEVVLHAEGEDVDLTSADPRRIIAVRRSTLGYVSQFLRVIPRITALDIVAEPALAAGLSDDEAKARARDLLSRLNIPQRLWGLPPATFSGGEQQRVNIARGFAGEHKLLLLDEPTASLDAANRAVVVTMIEERKRTGAGILGIFHDEDVRDKVADRVIDVTAFTPKREQAA